MSKPWNDSDLARLSADLDDELNAIFDQVEAALTLPDDPWTDNDLAEITNLEPGPAEGAPDSDLLSAITPADLPAEEPFLPEGLDIDAEDLDMDTALENAPLFPSGPAEAETDWLEPGLLGEPEISGELTPAATRELSRMIEAAVEKGVAAALAKIKS